VLYQTLKKKADAAMKNVRSSAIMNEKYQEWKRQLRKNAGGDDGGGTCSVVMSLEEEKPQRRTEKRKLLKSFREYTNPK
jgi:hypothetical protein